MHDHARLYGNPVQQDEPGQWLPQRRHTAQAWHGRRVGAITLRLVAHANGHSAAVPQLRDFHFAILVMAVLALGPVFDSLGLPPDAGANTSRSSKSTRSEDITESVDRQVIARVR
jgi:hypothetical protein